MKELVEYIAKSIVDNPDDVRVTEVEEDQHLVLRLHVAPEDMGKVIGRQGRGAQAMRTILRVLSVKRGTRAILEIGDDGGRARQDLGELSV
ncbi:MAG: KH domain-containing protein [Chloroflexi bacterium]|nr:KH domain-containing protein [Chloroflexota bacterium]